MFGDDGVEVDFDVLVRVVVSFIAGFLAEADGFLFEEEGTVYFWEEEVGHCHDGENPDGEDVSDLLLA